MSGFKVNDHAVVAGGHVILIKSKMLSTYYGVKFSESEPTDYNREDLIRHATAAEILAFQNQRKTRFERLTAIADAKQKASVAAFVKATAALDKDEESTTSEEDVKLSDDKK
jgi:hypothetical protein